MTPVVAPQRHLCTRVAVDTAEEQHAQGQTAEAAQFQLITTMDGGDVLDATLPVELPPQRGDSSDAGSGGDGVGSSNSSSRRMSSSRSSSQVGAFKKRHVEQRYGIPASSRSGVVGGG